MPAIFLLSCHDYVTLKPSIAIKIEKKATKMVSPVLKISHLICPTNEHSEKWAKNCCIKAIYIKSNSSTCMVVMKHNFFQCFMIHQIHKLGKSESDVNVSLKLISI